MGAYILRRLLLIIPTCRDHDHQLRADPVRARRADRTDHRRAAGPGRRVRDASPAAAVTATANADGDRARSDYHRRARPAARVHRRAGDSEFGFDKPPLERFLTMMWNYMTLRFRRELFPVDQVVDLVLEKMPVSITLGLWSTLIAYLISIPLGIRKAVQGRLDLRHLDLGRDHRRLCDPRLPVRHPAAGAVRRRVLFPDVPAARPDLGQLSTSSACWARSATISGTSPCRCWPRPSRPSPR